MLAILENPFIVVVILLVFAHGIGVSYMRHKLIPPPDYASRFAMVFPLIVLGLYRKQYGVDLAVRIIRGIRVAGFVSFAIGACVVNWAGWHA